MEDYLENLINWEDLSTECKSKVIGSNPEQCWHNLCIVYHAENRIRWKGLEYVDFYRDLVRHLRLKLEIFPYHLCRYLNFTSPFDYYIEMLCDLLRTQKGYECIPTFTASDILRIVGIHRNSYTELLSRCKEKGWVSKISRAIRSMLPKSPLSVPVEGWWVVFPLLHKKARKTASKNEVECLHEIYMDFSNKSSTYAGQYDREALEGLYKASVVEFDIEIEGIQFELIRDIKSFTMDKQGSGKQLGEILRLCEKCSDFKEVSQNCEFRSEIVKDCLGILSRLGFLDVITTGSGDWHKSWQPLSDAENSIASLLPSIEAGNSEDNTKITLAVGKNVNSAVVKSVKEILAKWSPEVVEAPNDAVVLNGVALDPIIFTNLNYAEAPFYRLFKLRFCGSLPVLYMVRGFLLTKIPEVLENFAFFLIHTDEVVKEVHRNDLFSEISKILPETSVFVIPLKFRFLNSITLPLPLNLISIKDRALIAFLRDSNLVNHFEHFVGFIQIAVLTEKNYLFLNQVHGIPFANKEMALSIANNLIESPWMKYGNLEIVAEAQQNEVFQFREFVCDVEIDQGYIFLT